MDDPAQALFDVTEAMFRENLPLMRRLIPADHRVRFYDHYPDTDVVNGPFTARYFYHCHHPDERGDNEHGHFHLFVGKEALSDFELLGPPPEKNDDDPDVVQIAALSISAAGLPLCWFATSQWVTDEWIYPATAIASILPDLSFEGTNGDALVNRWLTSMVRLSSPQILELLIERDKRLATLTEQNFDNAPEVLSSKAINLEVLFG